MNLRFGNQEYKLSHWVNCHHVSFYRYLHDKPFIPQSTVIYKSRSVRMSGLSQTIAFQHNNIGLRLSNKFNEPLRYMVYGEGLLFELGNLFNKINNYPSFKPVEIERAKMDLTNFLIKYQKNSCFA